MICKRCNQITAFEDKGDLCPGCVEDLRKPIKSKDVMICPYCRKQNKSNNQHLIPGNSYVCEFCNNEYKFIRHTSYETWKDI